MNDFQTEKQTEEERFQREERKTELKEDIGMRRSVNLGKNDCRQVNGSLYDYEAESRVTLSDCMLVPPSTCAKLAPNEKVGDQR